jgi:hypothetical protein
MAIVVERINEKPCDYRFRGVFNVKAEQKRVNWVLAFGFPDFEMEMWPGRATGVARKSYLFAFAKRKRVGEGSRFTSKR